MRVFVIGYGAREHALVWKIRQSPEVTEVFCAPGNAGSALCGTNIAIDVTRDGDFSSLADFAHEENIDLTVVGPEIPR